MKKRNETPFKDQPVLISHAKSIEEVEKACLTDPESGLNEEEAKKRLAEYGPNKLQEQKKKPFIVKLLKQFTEPMVIVLLFAALISVIIFIVKGVTNISKDLSFYLDNSEYIDALVILAIVIINALIGAIQEQKAEQSLDALKKLSTPMCTVRREGKLSTIKSEDLTIGDIVILEEGAIVPADLRLISSFNLKSDESSLTGESVPAGKDSKAICKEDSLIAERENMVYSSCPIAYGRGEGIVVNTGMSTEVGKIATLLDEGEDDKTPLQKKLAKLSKQLGLICLFIVIATFAIGIIWTVIRLCTSDSFSWSNFGYETLELFESSIALAVAAIPEGLSAIVTIALALGMNKMVKVNTIVRKLPSVETLGSVTVVCSDKTGTLTQNKMTIKKTSTNFQIKDSESCDLNESEVEILVTGMMLCSNASINGDRYGDPTELALLDYAKTFSLDKEECEKEQKRVDELPFDSVRKMMSTKNRKGDSYYMYTKGALDSILKHNKYIQVDSKIRKITIDDIKKIEENSACMSKEAYRVLALAYKEIGADEKMVEDDLIFVGMVGMIDPERKEAKHAITLFKEAGIRTVMITGDHKDTAFAIAKNLGIASSIEQCCSGEELNAMSEEELESKVRETNVFARVSPENKVQIVKALKANGEIVSMTGDGVNDAPSLKAADIGIAMGITGTDVAKSAADMVLTDDNFASIEKAVEEGRGIYANVKKAIFYLLSSNFGEVMVMFFTILLGLPAPLETLQILWINLITDSLPAISLSMSSKDKDIMQQKPRDPKDGIFAHGGFKFTLFYGFVIFLITFTAYLIPGILAYTGSNASFAPVYSEQIQSGYSGFVQVMEDSAVHREATTWAFTVLAIAQIFHMIGMTDIKRSFIHVFKDGNLMLLISFILGFLLQIAVTEIPPLENAFKTTGLSFVEWLILAALALLPLLIHEILAPIFKKRQVKVI